MFSYVAAYITQVSPALIIIMMAVHRNLILFYLDEALIQEIFTRKVADEIVTF